MPAADLANGHVLALPGPVRSLPFSYDSKNSEKSALQLVTAIRPEWASPDSRVDFIRFTDGITNTLLKAVVKKEGLSKEEVDAEAVLLRAYGHGTEVLIDRQREAQNHELLMKYGLAPELLARFENGMMYRFIRGKTTSPADLREPTIYKAVARRLAQWHATVPCIPSESTMNGGLAECTKTNGVDTIAPGKLSPNIWTVMQKWILAQPTETEEQKERQHTLQKELVRLADELSQRPGLGVDGLVFAHCDLLSGNVIVLPGGKEPANGTSEAASKPEVTVSFIDYEYATPSPAAFDIANHFAEWGGFDCDYSVLPTQAQRLEFIREYVKEYRGLISEQPGESPKEAEEVSKLCAEVDLYRGVPGFYWGIWAHIQAMISTIDFDYASYAEIRLAEYWAWRDEVSGARKAEGREMPLRERRWAQAE